MVQLCPVRGEAPVFAAVCLGRTEKPSLLGQNPPPVYTAAPMPSTCYQGMWSSCPRSMLTERLSAICCPGATGKIPVRVQLTDQRVTVRTCVCLVAQSCLTLCDPVDCSPPGSSVHGILQARVTGVGCHSLLQRPFLTQGSNLGLSHCRQILYRLSHQGSPLAKAASPHV